jgi:DNA-binding beta-propeller fold protein YncE
MSAVRWKLLPILCGTLLVPATRVAGAPGDRLTFVELERQGVEGVVGLSIPEGMTVSPDGLHVYVVTNSHVAAFARDASSGELTFIESEGASAATFRVAISPDGENLYATGGNSLATFVRDAGTGMITDVQQVDDGVNGVTGLVGAFGVAVSPDGKNVYVGCAVGDNLVAFTRDPGTGLLTFLEFHHDGANGVDGLDRALDVAVSPDGANVYVAAQDDNAVAVFSRDSATGALTFLEAEKDGVAGADGLFSAHGIAVSPDGGQVYVASGGELGVFSRDPGTGALTFLEMEKDGVNGVSGLSSGNMVAVSADGTHVYATGEGSDALVVFARDATTGALTYTQTLTDGVAGADALACATGVAVSPDSKHIYTTAECENAVGVYRPLTVACTPAPLPDVQCRTPSLPRRAKLVVKDMTPDDTDLVLWKWTKGNDTPAAAFGDPTTTFNDYALCVYDSSGAPAPLVEGVAPAAETCGTRPCWRATATGFSYKNPARFDGVLKVALKAGTTGVPKVVVKAKGPNIRTTPALPLTLPVTVQAQTADGECWTATYSTAVLNGPGTFKATSD